MCCFLLLNEICARRSFLYEDHSEPGDVDVLVVLLLGGVLGLHACDGGGGGFLDLFDHHAHSVDLTLPHYQFDSTLFFELLAEGLDRLLDTHVSDVLVFLGVFEDRGELLPILTHSMIIIENQKLTKFIN